MTGSRYFTREKTVLAFSIFVLGLGNLHAQLFPGLEGEDLVQAIRDEYTPVLWLNDTQVKDTLYAKIFIRDDSVQCVYSGLSRFLPGGTDPSQWLFGTGLEPGSINLEHAWPQSLGAGEGMPGNTNMYHLFPSRTLINSVRGNYPFQEIQDNLTQKWYFQDVEMSQKPGSNLDAYSEYIPGSFEPREDVKGDIARAMFYFWTIYRDDAVQADPDYFDLQKSALCDWHYSDPVDDFEALRNERISLYQDGKQNPFILDCTLARRTYCEMMEDCESVSTTLLHSASASLQYLADSRSLIIHDDRYSIWSVSILNNLGQLMWYSSIESNMVFRFPELGSGIYFLHANLNTQVLHQKIFIP